MAEIALQNQIDEINSKLDLLLEYVEQQRLKTQQVEDLVADVSIVGTDLFRATVEELDSKAVELDTEQLGILLVRLLKNIGNLNMVVGMFESLNDLAKDAVPVVNNIAYDLTNKIAEFESKGYFVILKNLNENSDRIFNLMRNITSPEVLQSMETITNVLTTVKPDENIDDKSLWKIMKQMKTPEVRKTISYALRLTTEIQKQLK